MPLVAPVTTAIFPFNLCKAAIFGTHSLAFQLIREHRERFVACCDRSDLKALSPSPTGGGDRNSLSGRSKDATNRKQAWSILSG